MSNDSKAQNDEIIHFEANSKGTSMWWRSENGTKSSDIYRMNLPEVTMTYGTAGRSPMTPRPILRPPSLLPSPSLLRSRLLPPSQPIVPPRQLPPPPPMKPLRPPQSPATSNGRRMDDDTEDTDDGSGSQIKKRRKKTREDLLTQYSLCNTAKRPIGQLVPVDIIPLLFPKLRNDPKIELKYDSRTEVPTWPRLILYSNNEYTSKLAESRFWAVDSAYTASDLGGLHLFTVFAITTCCVDATPLVYMILPNKSLDTYRRAFKAIQIAMPGCTGPEMLVVHLKRAERSMIYAVRSLYPGISIKACFSYTMRSFWMQARRQKVPEEFLTDHEARKQLSRLLLLVYLLPSPMYQQFCELINSPFFQKNHQALMPFLTDFQRSYVGNRDGTIQSIYPISIWNYYDIIIKLLTKEKPLSEIACLMHVNDTITFIANAGIATSTSADSDTSSITHDSQ